MYLIIRWGKWGSRILKTDFCDCKHTQKSRKQKRLCNSRGKKFEESLFSTIFQFSCTLQNYNLTWCQLKSKTLQKVINTSLQHNSNFLSYQTPHFFGYVKNRLRFPLLLFSLCYLLYQSNKYKKGYISAGILCFHIGPIEEN